ncbi:MAG: tetratricopeptide repeat protein, partial [Bacteroidota bacterium]|nr:tetratricopeptide repeat protein [Bacteroidota bacterium]
MMLRASLLSVFFVIILTACGGTAVVEEDPRIREGRQLYDRANFDRAQKHFQSLLADAERSGDTLLQAQALKWLGNVFLAYEQPDEALTWYLRSLALLDSGIAHRDSLDGDATARWREERQNVRSNTAVVHKSAGRFEEAAALFRDVLASDRTRGDDFHTAVSLYNLGDVYNQYAVSQRLQGDREGFSEHSRHARDLLRESLAVFPTADAWLNLGNNYAMARQLDSAITAYRRAEDIYRRDGFRVHRALALGNIGVLAQRLDRRVEAAEALRASIDIIEELRGNISSIDIRSSFISDKYYIYENLIHILVETGAVEEAFLYVERAKARSFLDMIGNKAIGAGKQRAPEVQALVDREQELQRRISQLLSAPDSSARLGGVIDAHREVLATLREKDPEYASVKSIDPLPVDSLQSALDDSTALIEYFLGRERSYLFIIRR